MMAWICLVCFFVPAVVGIRDIPVGLAYTKQWDGVCSALLTSSFVFYNSELIDQEIKSAARNMQEQHMSKYVDGTNIHEYFEYAYPEFPFVSEAKASIDATPQIRQHQCNPREFKMLINDFEPTNCQQLCMHCLPGSMPLCYSKSRNFPGIARTCLCSYDAENPFDDAAFSIYSGSMILQAKNERYKNKRELICTPGVGTVTLSNDVNTDKVMHIVNGFCL
uniref:Phlebovirus_G2 domain-containing protein n=1 Tax=Panagrellus redivivus TaxID=6233 RepID=A0A7E4W2Y4_PANRE